MRPALRRATVTLALTLVLPLLPATTGAQAADPVEVAAREVAAMQAEVDRSARELTEGTRRLERGQRELATVQRRLASARREAGEASQRSDQTRAQLNAVVAAAYRRPLAGGLRLALSAGAKGFGDAVAAQADLEQVRGRQQDLLAAASTERLRAAAATRSVEQLADDAARRTTDLDQQTQELRASADRTAALLSEAASRLAGARTAQATAAKAATQSGPALCTGSSGGYANGFLDAAALCPLDGVSGRLRSDAAAAFNRMTAAYRADTGSGLCVTDSYRSYAGQLSVFRRKPALAAVPGTSRHGLGIAVDFGCGIERFGSSAHRWMKANAGRFGWIHPSWAEPGGSLPEPWHWEYVG
ncbi:MAG: D-alanyl-D-alanine carboxypeptidase family protein [Frankiales bacterium]|nr:D-alanyl-D-alanine carboxypeptidase family protein [Frankiales bacterium]